VQWRRRIAKCVIKIGKMLQYHLRSFRRFLIALFLFSTLMILVNTTVFFGDTVFSSVASLNPNQTTDKTENTGINYKYMECFQQFQVSLFSLRLPSAIDVCVNNFSGLISARFQLGNDWKEIFLLSSVNDSAYMLHSTMQWWWDIIDINFYQWVRNFW
jgi:hypothetical protein